MKHFLTWKTAPKDSPIFSGRFVVSSTSHTKKAAEKDANRGGAEKANRIKVRLAADDDPIYSEGWTISPNTLGARRTRRLLKEGGNNEK